MPPAKICSEEDQYFTTCRENDDDEEEGDENEEGWFTPVESKRLSEKMVLQMERPTVIASQATQKKLTDFYSDIEGTLIQQPFLRSSNPRHALLQ